MWQFLFLFLSGCTATALYIDIFLHDFYSPLLLVAVRGLVSGLLIFLLRRKTSSSSNDLYRYKYQYFLAIGSGFLVPMLLQSFVLNKLPPLDIATIGTLEPICIYFLAFLFFKEKLLPQQILWLTLGTACAFVSVIFESGLARISLISWKEPLLLLITLFLAIGWVSIGNLVSRLNQAEDILTSIGLMTTGAVALILSFILEDPKFTWDVWPLLLFAIVILLGDLIATRMRARLSHQYTQTMLGMINIFSPFIVSFYEIFFDNKVYSSKLFVSLLPAIICFMLFYRLDNKSDQRFTNIFLKH